MNDPQDRCRLILVTPDAENTDETLSAVERALSGGDVAAVIIPQYNIHEGNFQEYAEKMIAIIQEKGAAAIIAGDTRIAGRLKADGLHLEATQQELTDAVSKYTPQMMIGAARIKNRHMALEIGEARPDYIFLGKLDGDIKPQAHEKNLKLANWWSELVEIPCVVMGGTDVNSSIEIATSGADFAAMRNSVFANSGQEGEQVKQINLLLDEKAPRFSATVEK